MGGNVSIYENHFHFKSLHFLLMDSMRLLKPKECKNFYVLLSGQNQPQKGSTVRFPSFTLAHSNYEEPNNYYDLFEDIILNIKSCFFVSLEEHTCTKAGDTFLLSPAEVFTVDGVNSKTVEDGEEYVEIVLKHSGLKSSHNCFIFPRVSGELEPFITVTERDRSPPAVVSTLWLASVLAALSLFSLTV
ncbi:NAD(P)(+)--arginine ADP-ribosyltransferase 2-like [Pundamilia nyererei]|uniref:NAD(P)(+)--arginine ADP-ribosyltransferase n=2 Tax=Haplochromini TaxID=319058 RepID=A0A9Y3QR97_9CICH|nr:PREDICTED: NAD(P)(+)--arginine ADP-ribosyltransferase 2-like [Pundamilia nyererei]